MRNRFGDPYTITATHTVSSTGHPVTVGKYATADGTFRPVDSHTHETAEALADMAKKAGLRIDKVTVQLDGGSLDIWTPEVKEEPKVTFDLDLIELRCRLRGWPVARTEGRRFGGPYAFVEGPWGFANTIGDSDIRDPSQGAILTAPRLTLANLVANPPEGWTCRDSGDDWGIWEWRDNDTTCQWWSDVPPSFMIDMMLPLPDQLAAIRAVTELFVLLGEIAPMKA